MQAVWPGITVDEKNLTVQISTLRRVLDDGQTERSCIQTEAGRGYRFVAPVTRHTADSEAANRPVPPDEDAAVPAASRADPGSAPSTPRLTAASLGAGIAACPGRTDSGHRAGRGAGSSSAGVDYRCRAKPDAICLRNRNVVPDVLVCAAAVHRRAAVPEPGADGQDDYLADAITDDLTTDLSRIAGAFVVARESAYTYKGKATDVRQIGRELGVRYVLEGSVRRIDATLRVNVQLISAETGAHLWSDRFDEEIGQLAAGQQLIIARMYDTIGFSLVDIESARSLRERPTSPDAFDLILRARSMEHLPQTPQRDKETLALYERALCWIRSRFLPSSGLHISSSTAGRPTLGQFREHATCRTAAGAGARAGSWISQGSQHHPLLAANGGPLCGGDRSRRACHPDRSEPDADGNRGLQRACRVQDVDRACRGGIGTSDTGGSAQSAQSLEAQPLPPHGLRCSDAGA